jgi:hypothetical protein
MKIEITIQAFIPVSLMASCLIFLVGFFSGTTNHPSRLTSYNEKPSCSKTTVAEQETITNKPNKQSNIHNEQANNQRTEVNININGHNLDDYPASEK